MTGWPRGRLPDLDAFDKLFLDTLVEAHLLADDDARGLDYRTLGLHSRPDGWTSPAGDKFRL